MQNNYTVDEEGIRLEEFLARQLPTHSLGTLRRAMVNQCARVNDVPRQRMWRLRRGDTVAFNIEGVLEVIIEPAEYSLDVLWEDEHAVVVNKPSGIGTVPDTRAGDTALLGGVYHLMGTRPFIVHRLDRATSGAIILAKSNPAAKWIGHQFEHRKIKKEYLAVVDGTPPREGSVDAPIGRAANNGPTFQAVKDGLAATTEYTVEETFGEFSLVKAMPLTGRTHQIRIHMAHIGHPLAVDTIYGKRTELTKRDIVPSEDKTPVISRLTLHASRIVFNSPSGEKADVTAPIPEDFEGLLKFLQGIKATDHEAAVPPEKHIFYRGEK